MSYPRRPLPGEEDAYQQQPAGHPDGYSQQPAGQQNGYAQQPPGQQNAFQPQPPGHQSSYPQQPPGQQNAFQQQSPGHPSSYPPPGHQDSYAQQPPGQQNGYQPPRQQNGLHHQPPAAYVSPAAPPPSYYSGTPAMAAPMAAVQQAVPSRSAIPVRPSLPGMAENGSAAHSSKPNFAEVSELPEHPPPKSYSGTEGDRDFRLEVTQQPVRARMCGFGDKDRRPITPPPCVRLAVIDRKTGKEIDFNQVDHQHFILTADLWSWDGRTELNLVRHHGATPAISAATHESFLEVDRQRRSQHQYPPFDGAPANSHYGRYPPTAYGQPSSGFYPPPPNYNGFQTPPSQYTLHGNRYPTDMTSSRGANQQASVGMYTRNLIGSLTTSASRLTDESDKLGIWFVLQDLSVRTEGFFRLRFAFGNMGVTGTTAGPHTSDGQQLNTGRSPVLATCFSEPFQVYSAKKFPGVCESTQLSKTFAAQGIKIPIRKEGEGDGSGSGNTGGEGDGSGSGNTGGKRKRHEEEEDADDGDGDGDE